MVFGQVQLGDGDPQGYSYRALVVRAAHREVLAEAGRARFSGWVGPQQGRDVVLVPSADHLLVAGGGRDLEGLGEVLAAHGPVLVVEVVRDRLLSLVLLRAGEEPLRYLSDPSVLDEDDLDEPRGVHHAGPLARAFGEPTVEGELAEALAEGLDPEHDIESERLERVLALLGLPAWVLSAWGMPRRVSAGPDPSAFTRLRAGAGGVAGRAQGWLVEPARRLRQRVSRRPDGPRPDGLAAGPGPEELW
jgi:hypothetical protein